MIRISAFAPAFALALFGAQVVRAEVPSYELVRVTSNGDQDPDRAVAQCDLKPGISTQTSDLQGIHSARSAAFQTDDAAVQALADAAPGIPRQDTDTSEHTSWWVIAHPGETPKLIRQNLHFTDGRKLVIQDQSDAGKTLATLVGINCSQTFGF